jgi:pyruvate,water dikinase
MDYVLNFEEVDRGSLSRVGGKNASLGEMIKAGIRVPPGFAVTTDAYLSFITVSGIREEMNRTLRDLNPDETQALLDASERVRRLVDEAPMPDDAKSAIQDHYARLCRKAGVDPLPVAVRSSATAEDLPTASFAGQQETYLWVRGIDEIIRRVQSCWSSLFTPRAISYRIKNHFPHDKVLISVGIQKMVNSKAAGVLFTLNPTDGDPSKMVIEGNWGLGETVVSGSVNPDKFVVDKIVMEISERTVSTKQIECVFDVNKGEVVEAEVAEDMQCKCCMEDREIKELVTTAKFIEKHYGCPMDIEWAIDRDFPFPENIFIVQARPETVWSRKKTEPILGKKSGFDLLMERAMKRIKIPTA